MLCDVCEKFVDISGKRSAIFYAKTSIFCPEVGGTTLSHKLSNFLSDYTALHGRLFTITAVSNLNPITLIFILFIFLYFVFLSFIFTCSSLF